MSPKTLVQANQSLLKAQQQLETTNRPLAEVLSTLQSVAELFLQAGKWDLYVKAGIQIIIYHIKSLQYDLGIQHAKLLLEIITEKQIADPLIKANVCEKMATCFYCKNQFTQALNYYTEAQSLVQKTPETATTQILLARICHNLANCHFNLGKLEKAIQQYETALAIRQKVIAPNHPQMASSFMALGRCAYKVVERKKALLFYQKALNIYLQNYGNNHPQVAYAYGALGETYFTFYQYEEALNYYQKALNIRSAVFGKEHPSVAYCYAYMGLIAFKKRAYPEALNYFQKALAIRLKVFGENHSSVAYCYMYMGRVCLMEQQHEQSLDYFQKALLVRQTLYASPHYEIAIIDDYIGRTYLAQQQHEKALQFFQQALHNLIPNYANKDVYDIPPTDKNLSFLRLYKILESKARVFEQLHQQDKTQLKNLLAAYANNDKLVALVNQTLQGYKTDASKLSWGEGMMFIYEDVIRLALELNQHPQISKTTSIPLTDIFTYIENSKAALLRSNLNETQAKITANIPADLLAQEKDLKIELNHLDKSIVNLEAIGTKKEDAELLKLQSNYFDAKQAYDQLIQQFEDKYRAYYNIKYNATTVSITQLQSCLQANTTLIEYFVGDKNIFIFKINSNNFEMKSLKKPRDFEEMLLAFDEFINKQNKGYYCELGQELYEVLIAPLALNLEEGNTSKQQELIIIPDGMLARLPFEALLYKSVSKKQEYKDLPYLLNHFSIRYHYSATLWYESKMVSRQQVGGKNIAPSFAGFAPVVYDGLVGEEKESERGSVSPYSGKRSVGLTIRGERYAALPFTEKEIESIKKLFEDKGLFATSFTRENANVKQFTQLLEKETFQFIHIAAHGVYNANQPDYSGILFSPSAEDEAEEKEDLITIQENETANNKTKRANEENRSKQYEENILHISDTYHFNLRATDLVVLSCCESGIGKLAKGEGMIAMNRGFLYAGAKNVIYTLFKVYDEASCELSTQLFTAILAGEPYASALRKAKLQLIRAQNLAPVYWAGYVLIGG